MQGICKKKKKGSLGNEMQMRGAGNCRTDERTGVKMGGTIR